MLIAACALITGVAIIIAALLEPHLSLRHAAMVLSLVPIEAMALWAVLRPDTYRMSWARAMTAMALGCVLLWWAAQDTLGAPRYVFIHQMWLLAIIVGSLVLTVFSLVAKLRARHAA